MVKGQMQLAKMILNLSLLYFPSIAGNPKMKNDICIILNRLHDSVLTSPNGAEVSVNCQMALLYRPWRPASQSTYLEVKFIKDGEEAEISYVVLPKIEQDLETAIIKAKKIRMKGEKAILFNTSNIDIKLVGNTEFLESDGDLYLVGVRTRGSTTLIETVRTPENLKFIQWLQKLLDVAKNNS